MRLFISYSSHNRDLADHIAADLRARGADVFIDYLRLEAGQSFSEQIRQQVIACDALILVVSLQSAASTWVRAEVELAHYLKKPIIPAVLERIDMANSPFWFLLYVEHVDFTPWATNQPVNEALGKLARALRLGETESPRLPFEPETVLVPAGPFIMGSTSEQIAAIQDKDVREWAEQSEQPQRRITLPDYRIGKYPVTVGEYRAFVAAGGYSERRFWTGAGWQQREKQSWTEPDYWTNPKWTHDDRLPVVGVSWYEATAYCRWLAEVTERPYRLPSEAEWEKAARGTDGRLYPWGDEWREGVCNTIESGIYHTTPVGQFSPDGDSPYGVADMSGNVFEWCRTPWRDRYDHNADESEEGDARRVVRGGSFIYRRNWSRCAYRDGNFPRYRVGNFGFRVVVLRPPSL